MGYAVEEEVLSKATKCRRDPSCRSEKQGPLCSVDYCVGGTILFVKSEDPVTCDYRVPYGDACACTCPVRKAIYDRHRV